MRTALKRASNAETFLITEFPWSLTMAWMTSYLTLFLRDEGLSAHWIGIGMGMGAAIQVAGLALSGSLSRMMGRKGSIMSGDFVGWVMVMGMWAVFKTPWVLLLGLVFNQGSGYVGPAWNSLFSEGEEPSRIGRYFFYLQLLTVIGGLLLPLVEPFIKAHGVVVTGRYLLYGLWPLVTVAWVLRLVYLRESDVGKKAMVQRTSIGTLWGHLKAGLYGTGGVLAGLRVILQVPLVLFGNFAPLALVAVHGTRLRPDQLAWLPLAATVGALGLWLLHRYTASSRYTRFLIVLSIALTGGGFALLAMLGPHSFWGAMTAWTLIVAGQSEFWTSHTGYWMAWLPDAVRVDVQGWIGVITAGLVAVLSPLVATGLATRPHPYFWAGAVLSVFAMGLWAWLPKGRESVTHKESRSG